MSEKDVHEWEYKWEDGHKTPYKLRTWDDPENKYHEVETIKYHVTQDGFSVNAFPPITAELARLADENKKLKAVAEAALKYGRCQTQDNWNILNKLCKKAGIENE
jgi:hypothetical protein